MKQIHFIYWPVCRDQLFCMSEQQYESSDADSTAAAMVSYSEAMAMN